MSQNQSVLTHRALFGEAARALLLASGILLADLVPRFLILLIPLLLWFLLLKNAGFGSESQEKKGRKSS